ncbi:hypothetical protein CRG98_034587 [Punica granatum]|uniref:RNase H type-1 domain-containing protein n=1 Tax=Punica granatum TaxID=22663 RepID=A0A2I0ILW9_PUNGR|nr:hypothetical protein CRG98_034587 [Punica granatum]
MANSAPRRLLGKLRRVLLSVLPNCECPLEFSGQYSTNFVCRNSVRPVSSYALPKRDEEILQVSDDEETPRWKIYFDDTVNSTGLGIGAMLISPEGRHFPVASKTDFTCTNIVAEYEACVLGLQATIDLKVKELEVLGDSMLIIFQTLKQWKTKDPKLVPYHEYLEELVENFEKVSFTYTPRMKNQFADALAMLASMVSITKVNLIEPLEFEITQGAAHCDAIEAVNGKPWILRRIAAHFFLSGETLYRRSFDATLLRCVDGNEAQRLMEEVHEGNYGPHMNGLMLAKKLIRLGYFWSTMAQVTNQSTAQRTVSNGSSVALFNVGYGCDRSYQSQSIQWTLIHTESKLKEAEWAKQRCEQLNLIDEKWLTVLCDGQCYHQRMARVFNEKVRPREFSPGDLVLWKVLHVDPDSRGKFAYKYDDTFIVKEAFDGRAIIPSDMDRNENALPVNADVLKKYYP